MCNEIQMIKENFKAASELMEKGMNNLMEVPIIIGKSNNELEKIEQKGKELLSGLTMDMVRGNNK